MEKEISGGAMLGIVLIALAAIIGLGFGIFAIAKGVANEGTVNVQDQLGQVSLATFNDYDQKIVTGTQVMSAYSNFAGKPYAILIQTNAFKKNPDKGSVSAAPRVAAGEETYLNYNAVLGGSDDKTAGSITVSVSTGTFVQADPFKMDDTGKIQFNAVTGNLSKSGQIEYVPSGGRYEAKLIKDQSGTIMGIAFQQATLGDE